jgi:hypothetical protein
MTLEKSLQLLFRGIKIIIRILISPNSDLRFNIFYRQLTQNNELFVMTLEF